MTKEATTMDPATKTMTNETTPAIMAEKTKHVADQNLCQLLKTWKSQSTISVETTAKM